MLLNKAVVWNAISVMLLEKSDCMECDVSYAFE
jgi:hypothetical protein